MTPPAVTELADPRTSRAVLVGAASYDWLPDLPAVGSNVAALAEALTDETLWGLPSVNCVRLTDPSTPVEFDRALRTATEAVDPAGMLLLYYAGHGLIEPASGSLHLAVGGTESESVHATGVPYDWVRYWVRRCRARRRVVVLDCCYAGRALDQMGAAVQVVDEAAIEQVCVLVSAPATRTALAPEGEPYTAFTGELLTLIRHGVPDGPELLDMQCLWRLTRQALHGKARPLPELRAHNAGEDIPLVRNAARPRVSLAGNILTVLAPVDRAGLRLLVLAHDPEYGALAVGLDSPSQRPVAAVLGEWRDLVAGPPLLYDGGPVDRRLAIAVAVRRPQAPAPPGFRAVRGRVGTFDLSADPAPARSALLGLRVFFGYFGWGPGQLDREVREGRITVTGEVGASLLTDG